MVQQRTNFYGVVNENMKENNPNWLQNPDYPYRLLVIRGFESVKTNSLFNLRNQQPDIEKIYLYELYTLKFHIKQNINF